MDKLLKKYNNRKIYDTETSQYVSLVDVEIMVSNGLSLKIIEVSTKKDITREIMTDIVLKNISNDGLNPVGYLSAVIRDEVLFSHRFKRRST